MSDNMISGAQSARLPDISESDPLRKYLEDRMQMVCSAIEAANDMMAEQKRRVYNLEQQREAISLALDALDRDKVAPPSQSAKY